MRNRIITGNTDGNKSWYGWLDYDGKIIMESGNGEYSIYSNNNDIFLTILCVRNCWFVFVD